jgi:major membrane immunogen (membrane-anchored lipoprotein)
MKRIILTVMALSFLLVGCGKKSTAELNTESVTDETEILEIELEVFEDSTDDMVIEE